MSGGEGTNLNSKQRRVKKGRRHFTRYVHNFKFIQKSKTSETLYFPINNPTSNRSKVYQTKNYLTCEFYKNFTQNLNQFQSYFPWPKIVPKVKTSELIN